MLSLVPFVRTSTVISHIDEALPQDGYAQFERFEGPFGVFNARNGLSESTTTDSTSMNAHSADSSGISQEGLDFAHAEVSTPALIISHLSAPQEALVSAETVLTHLVSRQADPWQFTSEHAAYLLNHYTEVVIPSLTPVKTGKTPWHVLFLPLVKTTMANITIGQATTSAERAVFFGTLALSATDISASPDGDTWPERAHIFAQIAYRNLEITLQESLEFPKRHKYKSVLMAILTLSQLSTSSDSWESTDNLLIEAERFIRLRGLTKSVKSRKVRMLHHLYAFARILQESISLTSSRAALQLEVITHVQQGAEVFIVGSDPPFFCTTDWQNLEEQFLQTKTQESGENDLHLSKPGSWPPSLYNEIFDVTEDWLSLLSQTIRLANEKELAENIDDTVLGIREFLARAKMLEKCLTVRARPFQHFGGNAISASNSNTVGKVTFNALQIYYYRRIHNLDAILMQPKVQSIKEGLDQYAETSPLFIASNVLVWSAFVAGCEAVDVNLQLYFINWFDKHARASTHSSCKQMVKLMKLVWQARASNHDMTTSWFEFL